LRLFRLCFFVGWLCCGGWFHGGGSLSL
jgi:hypothetical protein